MDDGRWTDLRGGVTPKTRGEVFNKVKKAGKKQVNQLFGLRKKSVKKMTQ
ncbi:hypothetical protein ACFSVN_08710 [Gracilimonas halophila]|uniref:Uncharacterized protein n=1 Tax=Gracilimonas halophila TaxID=1834464 RepID=A0ABW5JK51_9BACT